MTLKNTDTERLASPWKSVLLRFLYLSTGNQQVAEELTIDVFVEQQSYSASNSGESLEVRLLSLAIQRAKTVAPEVNAEITDPLVKALSKLSWEKRTLAILIGALSLNSVIAGRMVGLERHIVARVSIEAFTELRNELFAHRG